MCFFGCNAVRPRFTVSTEINAWRSLASSHAEDHAVSIPWDVIRNHETIVLARVIASTGPRRDSDGLFHAGKSYGNLTGTDFSGSVLFFETTVVIFFLQFFKISNSKTQEIFLRLKRHWVDFTVYYFIVYLFFEIVFIVLQENVFINKVHVWFENYWIKDSIEFCRFGFVCISEWRNNCWTKFRAFTPLKCLNKFKSWHAI